MSTAAVVLPRGMVCVYFPIVTLPVKYTTVQKSVSQFSIKITVQRVSECVNRKPPRSAEELSH